MKSRPILFSAAMVRAILDGSKAQTRRVAKLNCSGRVKLPGSVLNWHLDDPNASLACPYGQPGDQLTVREDTWMWCGKLVSGLTQKTKKPKICWMETRNTQPVYCADHPLIPQGVPENGRHKIGDLDYMWRKKIARFVPAWASRITLEIVSVRVERVQDISVQDAIAEGVSGANGALGSDPISTWHWVSKLGSPLSSTAWPRARYANLWSSINGPGSWNANPWVWVLTFKRIKP